MEWRSASERNHRLKYSSSDNDLDCRCNLYDEKLVVTGCNVAPHIGDVKVVSGGF